MLEAIGQTEQTFYETYTRTVLNDGYMPFIIKEPIQENKTDKFKGFEKLERQKRPPL